jgi:hypothetical protein
MVYLSPTFDGTTADIVMYFHGDAADYSADTANNYKRENPAIGMDLKTAMKAQSDHHRTPGQRAWGRHEVAVEHAGPGRLREYRADGVDESQERSRPEERDRQRPTQACTPGAVRCTA